MRSGNYKKLIEILKNNHGVAIAVSGGVDSMTLSYVANLFMDPKPTLYHAVSPAVPLSATTRLSYQAEQCHWNLVLLDAGEFQNDNYVKNPVNRCFFCKSNLYDRIRMEWKGPLFSGTNIDDLSEYRPGLIAAKKSEVRHPFVEAGINKIEVRSIAKKNGLNDLSKLPSAPCLSSRVETGIPIQKYDLNLIEKTESKLLSLLGAIDLRCRLRHQGISVELDALFLKGLDSQKMEAIEKIGREAARALGGRFCGVTTYSRGSTFKIDRVIEE